MCVQTGKNSHERHKHDLPEAGLHAGQQATQLGTADIVDSPQPWPWLLVGQSVLKDIIII